MMGGKAEYPKRPLKRGNRRMENLVIYGYRLLLYRGMGSNESCYFTLLPKEPT
jgi:hypothetical protein